MSGLIMHRTLAALTLAAACIGITVSGADNDLNALQQRIDRLDALTQRVEAISAIKRLQHAYGHCDALTVQTPSVTVLTFLQAINT